MTYAPTWLVPLVVVPPMKLGLVKNGCVTDITLVRLEVSMCLVILGAPTWPSAIKGTLIPFPSRLAI